MSFNRGKYIVSAMCVCPMKTDMCFVHVAQQSKHGGVFTCIIAHILSCLRFVVAFLIMGSF